MTSQFRLNRILPTTLVAMTCALFTTLAYSGSQVPEEHVGVNAERGEPARWAVPADTPQLKYDTRVKEAGAAQAEALKDCHAMQARRGTCEAEAHDQYRRDVEEARLRMTAPR